MDDSEDDEDSADDDELDAFETGVYLCRWPNGDSSVVTAESRREAILALDEWAGARPSQLTPIPGFMADFHLNDEGDIELLGLGEETLDVIWEVCYPALDEFLSTADLRTPDGELTPEG